MPRDRVMLSVHSYAWSGPGAWSPKAFTAGVVHGLLTLRDWASGLSLYGEMLGPNNSQQQQQQGASDATSSSSSNAAATTLEQQFDKEWGWCLKEDVVPVRVHCLHEHNFPSCARYKFLCSLFAHVLFVSLLLPSPSPRLVFLWCRGCTRRI